MNKQASLKSIEERFKTFLSESLHAINIDEMEIPKECQILQRADYILEDNIIIEIKTLEEDPSFKIKEKLEPYQDLDEYPLFYWHSNLQEILKHLPEGKKINEKIFFALTKSIQKSFEKADDQINDTKTIIGNKDAAGVFVLLNENVNIFDPEILTYIVKYMMNKRNKDGAIRYKNINFAYIINETHFCNYSTSTIATPLIWIHGPLSNSHETIFKKLEQYNEEWAKFNNKPLLSFKGSVQEFISKAFQVFNNTESSETNIATRHEIWRGLYRKEPYLRPLSEEHFITYGNKILEKLGPHFMKGKQKLPKQEVITTMILWTHYLEEAQTRNLNMKKLRPNF